MAIKQQHDGGESGESENGAGEAKWHRRGMAKKKKNALGGEIVSGSNEISESGAVKMKSSISR